MREKEFKTEDYEKEKVRKIDVEESKRQGRPVYIEIDDGIPKKTKYQHMTSGRKALMFYLSLFPLAFGIIIGYSSFPLLGNASGPGIEPVPRETLLALTVVVYMIGSVLVIGLTALLFTFFKRVDISPYQKRIHGIFIRNNIIMLIFYAQFLFIPFTNDFRSDYATVGGVVTGFFFAYWIIVFVEICFMQLRTQFEEKKKLMLFLDIVVSTGITLIYSMLITRLCFRDTTTIIVYNVITFVVFLIYNIVYKIMRMKKQISYEYIEELDEGDWYPGINIGIMVASNISAILIIAMFLTIFSLSE